MRLPVAKTGRSSLLRARSAVLTTPNHAECERSLFHDSVCSVFVHVRVYTPAIPMGFYGN